MAGFVSEMDLGSALHHVNKASLRFNDAQRSELRFTVNEHLMGKVQSSKARDSSVREVVGWILQELRYGLERLARADLDRLAPIALQFLFDFQQPSDCSFEERDLDALLSVLGRVETAVGPQRKDLLQEVDRIRTAASFPIMKLPAELRVLVSELVICDQQKFKLIPSPCGCRENDFNDRKEPAITTICRQLRHDSLSAFYASTNFSFHALRYDFSDLIAHCKAIESRWGVKKIKMVKLCLGDVNLNNSKVTIRCGDGLWDFFKWTTTTSTDVNFAVNRDGNFAPVNGVIQLPENARQMARWTMASSGRCSIHGCVCWIFTANAVLLCLSRTTIGTLAVANCRRWAGCIAAVGRNLAGQVERKH
ncbi:hypothetical protein LTR56_003742 [Elasticomyces elasticus]|nr:hypothetical protein LTR22_014620 [Elasticomyces elasticus]KAK3654884.1 hypothetical protein LTR56_003742 [Elasticomyces elasticus]KAK4928787.1 hypothetical protein LTR49_004596 [Elasticomyces elasticus]KAK5766587.1 hypothetical protein LTS12_003206 [Elasticomyces elasticus]